MKEKSREKELFPIFNNRRTQFLLFAYLLRSFIKNLLWVFTFALIEILSPRNQPTFRCPWVASYFLENDLLCESPFLILHFFLLNFFNFLSPHYALSSLSSLATLLSCHCICYLWYSLLPRDCYAAPLLRYGYCYCCQCHCRWVFYFSWFFLVVDDFFFAQLLAGNSCHLQWLRFGFATLKKKRQQSLLTSKRNAPLV